MADPGLGDLPLRAYQPRQMLRVRSRAPERPRFPVIDAHNHTGPEFGGDWVSRDPRELLAVLDEAGIEHFADMDGGWGEGLRSRIERFQRPFPDRFSVFAGLDYEAWRHEAAFGALEAARLRKAAAAGARGLKVWKLLGLRARDPQGRLVGVDDSRLDPVWATAGELGLPVLIHVADPMAFFLPLSPENERLEELQAHPDWHFYPPQPADRPDAPGFPPFDTLIDGLERLLSRHPRTVFIGAHVGCCAEDLGRVGRMLHRHPNYVVDIAGRTAELGRQPRTAARFFRRFRDRVLFGSDMPARVEEYRVQYRFLETDDESFPYDPDGLLPQGRWMVHGLALSDDVLRRVYAENARRVLRLGLGI